MTSESPGTAPPRIGLRPKLSRFVLTVVIATLLGPLIVGGTVFVVFVAMQIVQSGFNAAGIGEFAAEIGKLFILLVGAAYFGGSVIALVAGTIVAVVALRRQVTFVVIIAAIVVANVGYFAVTEPEIFYSTDLTMPLQRLVGNLAYSAFAATICWLLFPQLLKNT